MLTGAHKSLNGAHKAPKALTRPQGSQPPQSNSPKRKLPATPAPTETTIKNNAERTTNPNPVRQVGAHVGITGPAHKRSLRIPSLKRRHRLGSTTNSASTRPLQRSQLTRASGHTRLVTVLLLRRRATCHTGGSQSLPAYTRNGHTATNCQPRMEQTAVQSKTEPTEEVLTAEQVMLTHMPSYT